MTDTANPDFTGLLPPFFSTPTPAAACQRCGGWLSSGGMSQYHRTTAPVMRRFGCLCNAPPAYRRLVSDAVAAEFRRLEVENSCYDIL